MQSVNTCVLTYNPSIKLLDCELEFLYRTAALEVKMANKWISRLFHEYLYQPVDQTPLTEEDEEPKVNGLPESNIKSRSGRFHKLNFWILIILWLGSLGLVSFYYSSIWPKVGSFCDESHNLAKSPIPSGEKKCLAIEIVWNGTILSSPASSLDYQNIC